MSERTWVRRRRLNICILCAKPAALSTRKGANGFSNYCPKHRAEHREYMRKVLKSKRRNSNSESYEFNVTK